MAYLEYGCGPLPDHEPISCGNFNYGAISAIGILDESSFGSGGLDFQTALDWSNGAKYIQAINAGRLSIIAKIRGNVPDASPNDAVLTMLIGFAEYRRRRRRIEDRS